MKAGSKKQKKIKTRREEEWARRVMGQHLGCIVERNDDGSQASMYDLRVGAYDDPEIAIECVRDIDERAIKIWKRGPLRSPIQVAAPGDWQQIQLGRSADLRKLAGVLPSLLARLHETSGPTIVVDQQLQTSNPELFFELSELNIDHMHRSDMDGSGRVFFTMALVGGIVQESGNDIADWLTSFLAREDCRDNLRKLEISGAAQRHIFVMPTLLGTFIAPMFHHFEATYTLPQKAPILPPAITAAWIVPTATHTGLFWNGNTWDIVDPQ